MPAFTLIDGNSYIHRAYHALPALSAPDGTPVNAVYGFSRMMLKIIRQKTPSHLAVCFDYPARTFRHDRCAEYKAHRAPLEPDLKAQMPLARAAAAAMGIIGIEVEGYEADDIIATLARAARRDGADVLIVSGDKDLLQLVDAGIRVFDEFRGTTYDQAAVMSRFGLAPGQLKDFFALTGDSSDNVPGVPGIGEKTARRLLERYGTLDRLLSGEVEDEKLRRRLAEHEAVARESRMLVTLADDVPLDRSWRDCAFAGIDRVAASAFFLNLRFNSLLADIPFPEENALPDTVIQAPLMEKTDEQPGPLIADATPGELAALKAAARSAGYCALSRLAGSRDIAVTVDGTKAVIVSDEMIDDIWLSPAIEKRCADYKSLRGRLVVRGIEPAGSVFDAALALYCLDPAAGSGALAEAARERLNIILHSDVKGSDPRLCAGARAVAVLGLAGPVRESLKSTGLWALYEELELPLVRVLTDMEAAGMGVDAAYLTILKSEFAGRLERLSAETQELAGRSFNMNSPRQLAVVLFQDLKLPPGRKTKTGYSTDEETLRSLAPLHPLPASLLAYRELQKLQSTYVEALLGLIDPVDGRVHTTFNQVVTATGRLSSSDPNLQNIPVQGEYGGRIRRAFVAAPGMALVSADYSQIELRVLAHMSGDQSLRAAFAQGRDIHSATACDVLGKTQRELTADDRRLAKSINFGIIYGISPFGLSQQLGISIAAARAYIDRYFASYPGVRRWIEKTIADARSRGFVSTLMGRRRSLPDLRSGNTQARSFAERAAMNTPIQGTAADIIKRAMIGLHARMQEVPGARLVLQVHDELIVEVPRGGIAAVALLMRDEMQNAARLDVPLIVDIKAGPSWSDGEPVK